MDSLDDLILNHMRKSASGEVHLIDDFAELGNYSAIRVALHRLVKKGVLQRVVRGMYVLPQTSKLLNSEVPISLDKIARAIARRDNARIMPTGSYAMHALGLSTQIPLNVVYYTDGTPRKLKVGKRSITFKKASAKTLSYRGEISKLAILALRDIGQGKLTNQEEEKLLSLLKKEDIDDLKHDIRMAPQWIGEFMSQAFRS